MTSRSLRLALALAMLTGAVGCSGSRSNGATPPKYVYLPSASEPCLRTPPPTRPKLRPCLPSETSCVDENLSSILTYAASLDVWARTAWAMCGVKPIGEGERA